ncbi:MAG: oligoendopeptidase F [Pirellulaceae bacterium]|jgi:oligoendopeptidase F
MSTVKQLPPRTEVKTNDTWDLSSLVENDEAWEAGFKKFEEQIQGIADFQGKLGESAETLAACLKFDSELDRIGEHLGTYAFLKTAEDQTNSDYQRMIGRFQNIAAKAGQLASYIRPELMAIPDETMKQWLETPVLEPYGLLLERILRYKPYTLSEKEESLLALQAEMSSAAGKIFRQLHDADMKFGNVEDENGELVELGNSTLMKFLISPDRSVRENAFRQYYQQFKAHENTLAATLSGSIQKDVYYARARGYEGCLEQSRFPDNVPQSVYDNLITSVRNNLPALHRYYDVRRRKMGLDDIHHYDTYVPILNDLETNRPWEEAVSLCVGALEPLGSEYCDIMNEGLSGRWCDRYPNQGKQSGGFSCGTFDGDPYILMNYKPEVLDDVFTLAHEAGHSMHSYYSSKHQPFEYYNYTIFVAEVASTFNEQLLSKYMMDRAADDRERAYLLNREIDGIRGTILRQTMFAEFEKITHEMAEQGEPLTIDAFKSVYRELLEAYFGPEFRIDDELSLECLRIPHFYRAFYVYKYATGLSAAIALSQRVLTGGEQQLKDYLGFLKGGCSKHPLDLLRDAGVDMERPEPVDTALKHFDKMVDELDSLI